MKIIHSKEWSGVRGHIWDKKTLWAMRYGWPHGPPWAKVWRAEYGRAWWQTWWEYQAVSERKNRTAANDKRHFTNKGEQ